MIALEADDDYAARLVTRFEGEPRVRTLHSSVEDTDWGALGKERLDSVVLSNVLEHIEDDAAAICNFPKEQHKGGTMVVLVPALPPLFGTLDEAVGHFRRYMPATLRGVIEGNGFHVERLEWMNLVGIPGWFLNGRVLQRRVIPAAQLRIYDFLAPLIARMESSFRLPLGLSLLAVARAV